MRKKEGIVGGRSPQTWNDNLLFLSASKKKEEIAEVESFLYDPYGRQRSVDKEGGERCQTPTSWDPMDTGNQKKTYVHAQWLVRIRF